MAIASDVTPDQIPLFSLADADAERLVEILHRVGFAVLTDHGVPAGQIAETFDMMHRFFALPDATKRLIDKTASPWLRGWEPVGTEYTNNRVDVREQIDVWTPWPIVSEDELAGAPPWARLHGPNQWLPDEVLDGHRRISMAWIGALDGVASTLLGLISEGLGLGPGRLAELYGDRPMSLTKFIHYPPTPPGGAGVNAHHDAGFLTVLAPGPVAGLEVQLADGSWAAVPLIPDTFVINLGENLQAMTGNYLVATPHRVVTADERYSSAYFQGPSFDTPLVRLPLDERFEAAVAASPRHRDAGFMARKEQTDAGVGDMQNREAAATYGDQIWNYFVRSYPDHPTITAT